ncbi:serine/threonine-protein kinase [Allosediminivita pacifica]|uniref:WD domain G-beta repeat uncharacterized protein n=1 Tax=Allosediminivita pacifica TaxID=1267769 RepID=A0A2T6B5U8_9RHOB|nr:serine/threonine-protein kinase [Allosediminivita pacifica]PTX51424.1 WD domain G-beta repeat uncharacterized protein [Allosediminivita pacifica]GGA99719.1 hypothetical protein GCM10011324_07450 [Allosediminivita pacifica]
MTDLEELSDTQLPPGATLADGQYTITRFLASGGFGMTYMAQDRFGRDVVIKECFPAGLSRRTHDTRVRPASKSSEPTFEKCIALFLREAETLAGLNSPHVVNVLTAFTENGTAYMVMNYVQGSDFQTVIDRYPERLTPDYVMMFAHYLLSAVATVHSANILHRDIKPGNILVDPEGKPVVIDFGAARVEATKQSVKLSTLPVVADGYSPNEFYITGVEQGLASDLYSVAATFYAAITGHAPPPAPERNQALAEQKTDPLVPLTGNHPGYPPVFLASIDQTLSLARRDRIQSAGEWQEMLRPVMPDTMALGQSVAQNYAAAHHPPAPPEPILGKLLLASVAGLAIGAVAMAAVSGSFGSRLPEIPTDVAALHARATQAENETEALRDRLTVGAGQLADAENRITILSAQLENVRQQRGTEVAALEQRLADAETAARKLQSQLDAASLGETQEVAALRDQLDKAQANGNTSDAELERQLSAERNTSAALRRELQQARDEAQAEIARLNAQLRQAQGQQGQDGARLVPAVQQQDDPGPAVQPSGPAASLAAWRRDTFGSQVLRGHTEVVRAVAFDPRGELIVSGGNDNTVRVWDAETGRLRQTLTGHEKDVTSVAFSPDGQFFISASDEGRITVWDTRRLTQRRSIETGNTFVQSAVVGPGSDRIAAGLPDGSVRIWGREDAPPQVVDAHSDWVTGVAFSPDGNLIASGSYDRTVRIWDARTEALLADLGDAEAWITSVSFAPDGQTLYATTQDEMVLAWTRSGDTWRLADAPVAGVTSIAASPSSEFLVTGSDDSQVQLRDRELRVRRVLGGHGDQIRAVAVGPGGRQIISASDDETLRLLTLDQ